jgi:hypothetical protein
MLSPVGMITRRIRKRKAISTFIATLLLMVLAVAAGVVIYAYTMGYLGGFSTPQQMGALSIDTYTLDPTVAATVPPANYALSAYLRNIGHSSFTAATVYVDGVLVPTGEWDFNGGVALPENQVGLLKIMQATAGSNNRFRSSVTSEIKLIGLDNTQLQFQVKK